METKVVNQNATDWVVKINGTEVVWIKREKKTYRVTFAGWPFVHYYSSLTKARNFAVKIAQLRAK